MDILICFLGKKLFGMLFGGGFVWLQLLRFEFFSL